MPKIKKKNKAFDLLSQISGIPRNEIRRIANSVMENKKLLNSCLFHEFEPIDNANMSRIFKCKNCNGTVGIREKVWYELGVKHGKI